MKVVSKRHWFSYTMNVFMLIFVCAPAFSMYYKHKQELVLPFWKYSVPILIGVVFYQNLRSIILNSRIKWVFENEVLTIKSGLLPWRRTNFGFTKDKIYDIFYNKSFLGSILNYGHLTVRRTDGTTSRFSVSKMTNPKKMVQVVSASLEKNLTNSEIQGNRPTKASVVDDLQKLADLQNSGKISDDEFKKLKTRILRDLDGY